MQLVSIGYGNYLLADKLRSMVSPEAAPVKRMVAQARACGKLIDASCGRKTKSVIMMDSDHVVLSAWDTEQIAEQFQNKEEKHE